MSKNSKISKRIKRVLAWMLCLLMLLDGGVLALANGDQTSDPAQEISLQDESDDSTEEDDNAESDDVTKDGDNTNGDDGNGEDNNTDGNDGNEGDNNTDGDGSNGEDNNTDGDDGNGEDNNTDGDDGNEGDDNTDGDDDTKDDDDTDSNNSSVSGNSSVSDNDVSGNDLEISDEERARLAELERLEEIYNGFVEEVEAVETIGELNAESIKTATDLYERISTACTEGDLTEERGTELMERLERLINAYWIENSVAETGNPNFNLQQALQQSEQLAAAYYTTPLIPDDIIPTTYRMRRSVGRPVTPQSEEKKNEQDPLQVAERGGVTEDTANGVSISKTIAASGIENVFDITLKVTTKENFSELYKDPDMAVVIVMDISNTMKSYFTGTTKSRYEEALGAAKAFMEMFADNTTSNSKLGYVAFNTHAHEIFGLSSCTTDAEVARLKSTVDTETGNIINESGYGTSTKRFTNMEAGLKRAYDMLKDAPNENKYILFLSDGFPTTYLNNKTTNDQYDGYNPYTGSGKAGTDGVFYDALMGVHCDSGTSYSEEAAIRARKMATTIKNNNISIFSVGVDVSGQSIKEYSDDSKTRLKTSSVVDRPKNSNTEVGDYEIGYEDPTVAGKTNFEDWLKGGQNKGIGSGDGYYKSVNKSGELEAAYANIFTSIKQDILTKAQADWVATDPMPVGANNDKMIEFIGFFDNAGTLHEQMSGQHTENGEDTASFTDDQISWKIQNSGYSTKTEGNTTWYTYELVYRVRLKNEKSNFVDTVEDPANSIYDTNGETYLTYRVLEEENGKVSRSEEKKLIFEVPAVKGYLVEFDFQKVDEENNVLEGAEFTLTHDTDKCTICHGDDQPIETISDYTATSDKTGTVSFEKVPSGHIYKLEETKAPTGYVSGTDVYTVTAAYDEVTITDKDGNDRTLDLTIINRMIMALPAAGGIGTGIYLIGGSLLMMTSAGLSFWNRRKKAGEM